MMSQRTLRVLGIVLAVLMLVTAFAACQKSTTSPTVAPSPSDSPSATNSTALESPKIDPSTFAGKTITSYGGAAPTEEDNLAGWLKWNEFKSTYNVNFAYTTVPDSDPATKLTMMVATNQGPDILEGDNTLMPLYAARGLVQPIDSWVNEKDNTFLFEVMDAYKWKDQRYCLQQRSWATFRSIIFNSGVFEDLGLKLPTDRYFNEGGYTWNQLFADSKALKVYNDANAITNYGWTFTLVDVGFALGLNNAAIYSFNETTQKYDLNLSDSKVQNVLTMLYDNVANENIDYRWSGDNDLANGTVRMYNQVWERSERITRSNQTAIDNNTKLMSVPLPVGPDVEGTLGTGQHMFGVVPWFYMIGSNCAAPEAAYYWLWYSNNPAIETPWREGDETPPPRIDLTPEYQKYIYSYLEEVRAGDVGELKVVPNIEGVPGFSDRMTALCNRVYRDKESLSTVLTELEPLMQKDLEDLLTGYGEVKPASTPELPEAITFDADLSAVKVAEELPDGVTVEWVADGIDGGSLKVTFEGLFEDSVDLFSLASGLFPALNYYTFSFDYKIEGDEYNVGSDGALISIYQPDGDYLGGSTSGALDPEGTAEVSKVIYLDQREEDQNVVVFGIGSIEDTVSILIDNISVTSTEISVEE